MTDRDRTRPHPGKYLPSILLVLGFLIGARGEKVASEKAAEPAESASRRSASSEKHPAEKLPPEKIIRRWADGPVRYIMTGKEEETLRGLKSLADLARFITGFWARRDPTPGTFENEYRRMYWSRVAEANRRFRSSVTPGWKTDRGKIFIILGEPFDIQTNQSGKGSERWTYQRRFSKTADPQFNLVFVRGNGDDLELSNSPQVVSPFYDFQGLVLDPGPVLPAAITAEVQDAVASIETTSVGANLDLGNELAAASNTELILATVTTRDFVSAFTAAPRFEFFRAKDGSTFVNVCGLMKASDLYGDLSSGVSRQRVYASMEPADHSGEARYASNEKEPSVIDLSKGLEPGGLVAVWTGLAVKPGRYRATMAIEDSLTGRLGRAASDLQVPDFSGSGLSLSTVVLASALAEAKDRMSVTARSSGVFRRSEDFGIYYEVYGLPEPPEAVKFDVTYRFSRVTPQGAEPIGRPLAFAGRTEASQGWSFPLARWPEGKYRLEVAVTDPAGRSTTAETSFEVAE